MFSLDFKLFVFYSELYYENKKVFELNDYSYIKLSREVYVELFLH